MNIQVHGETLRSLRNRYKANLEYASRLTGIRSDLLDAWEREGVELPLQQVKRLAKSYNAHWSVFLLTKGVKPIDELTSHRAGYSNNAKFSMDTMRAYEVARSLLNASIEIDGRTVNQALLDLSDRVTTPGPIEQAHEIRSLLALSTADIRNVSPHGRKVYAFWRDVVDALGVYVSEQEMPENETKAFLMRDGRRAIIVINQNDRYPYSKVFSLLHELGHLILGESSAACLVSQYAVRTSSDEQWCNKFASELMAYDEEVLAEHVVEGLHQLSDPSSAIRYLAARYRTSFTVMLYKLKSHHKVTDQQCKEMLKFFESVIMTSFRKKATPTKKDDGFKLPRTYFVNREISRASIGLTKEVIQRQMGSGLAYADAARILGTKVGYLDDIKHSVGFGS